MTTWAITSRASRTSGSLTGESSPPFSPTPSTTPSFDPSSPLLGKDGLEYEDFGDWLCRKPAQCQRNDHIQRFRAEGRSEEAIRAWIEGYDKGAERFAFQEERAEWRQGKVGPCTRRRVQAINAVAACEAGAASLNGLVRADLDSYLAGVCAGW
jgi:hypothetical protein